MKKSYIFVICCLLLLITSFTGIHAQQETFKEDDNLKIIINGSFYTFQKSPIGNNKELLLPYKECLTSLGLNNDDEHFVWNQTSQTVTFKGDTTKIDLQIQSKKAYVNNRSIELSFAPIIYNDIIYVPAKFIYENLNQEYIYFKDNNILTICDSEKYQKNENIIEKANKALGSLERYKVNCISTLKYTKYDLLLQIDNTKKIEHTVLNVGAKAGPTKNDDYNESYQIGDVHLFRAGIDDEYEASIETEEQFPSSLLNYIIKGEEAKLLSALLNLKNSNDSNDIVLEYTLFNDDNRTLTNISIKLDNETYLYKEINRSTILEDNNGIKQNDSTDIKFFDINSDFRIDLPKDVEKLKIQAIAMDEYSKGNSLLFQEKYIEAIKKFDSSIKLDPSNYLVYYNKGKAYEKLSKLNEALKCYDKAAQLNPNDISILSDKGYIHRQLNQFNDALKCYDKIITLNPDYAYAYHSKGLILDNLGRYNEALKFYDLAIAKNPQDIGAYNNKGNLLNTLKKYKEADDCYRKGLKIEPTDAYNYNNKANIYDNLGRYKEALDCYNKALELDQNDANIVQFR